MHYVEAELQDLFAPSKKEAAEAGSESVVQRLRSAHHKLAQLIAEGRDSADVSRLSGYSASRISVLQRDQAFKELVESYRAKIEVQYVNLHERLAALAEDAVEEVMARLEEEPDAITTKTLVEIIKTAADRSGHGPSSQTNLSLTHDIAPDVLETIKNSLQQRGQVRPISDAYSRNFEDCEVLDVTPVEYSKDEAERLESSGDNIREESGEISSQALSENPFPLRSVDIV